jgi:hypothetical protein
MAKARLVSKKKVNRKQWDGVKIPQVPYNRAVGVISNYHANKQEYEDLLDVTHYGGEFKQEKHYKSDQTCNKAVRREELSRKIAAVEEGLADLGMPPIYRPLMLDKFRYTVAVYWPREYPRYRWQYWKKRLIYSVAQRLGYLKESEVS